MAQSDVATAKWMHVTVDGNNNEWGSLNFYDDQTQLNFGIANDTNNIYLCFSAGNGPAQMKLMHAGMKITLSTKGKPKHEASILFPLPQNKQQQFTDSAFNKNNSPAPGAQPVFNKETFRQSYVAHHSVMQVSGFASANGEISTSDSDIHVAVNWDSSSNMIYEVAIAKKEFFGNGFTTKDVLSDITLDVELNGLSHSETGDAKTGGGSHGGGMHGSMEGENSGGGSHGGGIHGSGMHGGGFNSDGQHGSNSPNANMNNSNNVSLNQKTSFKQKFILNDGTN